MLLTIHDANLNQVASIDNDKSDTLNYFDDTWTRDLETGSSTFEFSVYKKSLKSDTAYKKAYNYLNEKAFVSFVYKGQTYLFNVMTVEEDETTIQCYCENLNLELISEYANPYKAEKAMSFVEYCNAMDLFNMAKLTVGRNEISDYRRTLEWEGQDTKLARLLSLANKFDAEIDFETILNDDSSLKSFKVNIYHENDDTHQGVGRVRSDIRLTYGKNLKSITRKVDKTGIFNMIVPTSSKTVDNDTDSGESSSKTVTTTNADGSITKTTTKKASDGTTVQTKVTTKVVENADGSKVTTVRTEKSDGSITEKVTTKSANGNTDTVTKTIREATKENTETVDEYITIAGLPDWEIKNDDGIVEFYKKGEALYAPISARLYPSTFTTETQSDQWIRHDMSFDVDSDTKLETEGLKQLKANAYPALTYTIKGYIDADIGDTLSMSDTGFVPTLLLTARVSNQKLSFTQPSKNETTLANFKALESGLTDDIQSRLEELIESSKPYTIRIASTNGTTFKNNTGESTITATLLKGDKTVSADVTWRWALDGNVSVGMQYLARAENIDGTAVLTVSAYIGNNEVATTEITLTNVNDGADGAKGDKGDDGAKGDKGETGNGIANTVITYGLSSSETIEPATWASNMPVLVKGMYLWTRTVQIYTNGTSSTSYQKGYIAKDGAQGLPGTPGKDAQTQYTHIAYADNATGGGFSLTDNTKPYWGMYQDFNAANSNDPTKYKWSKWKGDQGLPGAPGVDGKTPYIHFAYADNATGSNFSLTDKNQQYMGYYSDYTEANSTDYKKYTWVDRLANVQVGGRNLWIQSRNEKGWILSNTPFQMSGSQGSIEKEWTSDYIEVTPGEHYFFQGWVTIPASGFSWRCWRFFSSDKTVLGDRVVPSASSTVGAQHFKDGLTAPANAKYVRFSARFYSDGKFKVERGTVCTDWSPALEDTQEQIDSKADSALTQEQLNALEAKRLQMETEMKALATLQQVSELETFINNLKKEDLDGRQKIIEITKAIEERVKDIEPIMEYSQKLKFMDTYITQGNGGMIIGANDSTTKVVVTPDRISFQSGGSEVAYISQRMLHIDNGVFTMSLQLGHYITRAHLKNEYVNATYFVK